jgi:hypothetical protein
MADYIDLLVAAGWVEACTYCKGSRRGKIHHLNTHHMHSLDVVEIDCWFCVDPHSIQKHVDSCQRCVQPFKRRGGGQSLIPPKQQPSFLHETWTDVYVKHDGMTGAIMEVFCPMCNHTMKAYRGLGAWLTCMKCGHRWYSND